MSPQAWQVAAIVIGAMALFASEKLRYDVIALLVLALLLVLGIVTPAEGLSGFSNEATVVIAAMFALNAGVVGTGGLDPVIGLLVRIRQPWLLSLAIMLLMAALGMFIKNTALVATFLPVALTVCSRTRTPPS
ncbi:MAG TPA: SLC13 family permease, partial [Xanthomonadaceae bacterium]|nr:SLC13 family permease [Xanthomonadaceae bacterium]